MHFVNMLQMREELAGMGSSIKDEDFCTILTNSLPTMYGSVIASLYTTAQITQKTLTSHNITVAIQDEYSRQEIQSGSGSTSSAFLLKSSKKDKKEKKKSNLVCANPKCQKTGHTIENCWKEGGGKAGQGLRQQVKAKKNQEGTQPLKEVKTATIEEVTDQEASMHAFTALPIAND
jgi:hypothetical protein